ncbi:MAG: hypothetical protein LBV33_08130 [Lachnospiraceae bacterium]|nr:hypothetical protein [Lachnospiraceae bacterium]
MQIFMLYILAKHNTGFWQKNRTLHYFVIGSFTFFINFLSAPLLTLGLPVILDMLLDNGHKNKLWTATKAIFAWIGGYGITILAKQIMAKLVLGQQSGLWQILHWSGLGMAEGSDDTSIISRILSGSSGLDNQVTFTDRLLKVVVRSADVINPTTGFILVTIIIAVIILILLKKIKLILPDRQIIPVFFMIGALPFLWLFIFAVHAGHGFDSMSLSVFIFSLLSFGASFIKIDNN